MWAIRRAAISCNAGSDLAESTRGTGPRALEEGPEPSPVWVPAAAPAGAGASSKIRWALVPLMPKEETPARRGLPFGSQGTCSLSSSIRPASHSTFEEGASTGRVFGSTPSRIAITVLITPATPAAEPVGARVDVDEAT